jgi:ubiquinone biosynthesis protein
MLRILDLVKIVAKYRLDEYLSKHDRTKFLNAGGNFVRRFLFGKPIEGPLGYRLRKALEELGPVFVKLGQIISTRRDLLPPDVANELVKLRDNVKPFDNDIAISIVERDLKGKVDDIFAYFSLTPVASASISQVHLAILPNGDEVAVKILRPGIKPIIRIDLQLLKNLISTVNLFKSNLKDFNFLGIVEELEVSIKQELNFLLEAENAEKFRENLKDYQGVCIPKIYKELSTRNVLVMERMYGTPIDHVTELTAKGINLKQVARQGIELLLLQVFRDRFFHADPHAGNVWITDDGSRVYLDFGIMGTLTKEDRDTIIKLIAALSMQDYQQFVKVQIDAGWVPDNVDKNALSKAFHNLDNLMASHSKNSAMTALRRLLNLGEKFGVKTPVQFTLLIKTLIAAEGIAKTIDPTIDLTEEVKPIMMKNFAKWLSKGT